MAVAVDDIVAADGSSDEPTAWDQADLDRLTVLVQDAVGYDIARGDRVTVVNTPFLKLEPEPIPEVQPQLWEQAWFWTTVKMVLGVLAFIIVVFMVLRPTMRRLTENSRKIKALEIKHQEALNAVNEVAAGAEATISPDGEVRITGSSKNLLPSPQDGLDEHIDLVKNMIDENPERVAQVIQGWTKAGD